MTAGYNAAHNLLHTVVLFFIALPPPLRPTPCKRPHLLKLLHVRLLDRLIADSGVVKRSHRQGHAALQIGRDARVGVKGVRGKTKCWQEGLQMQGRR